MAYERPKLITAQKQLRIVREVRDLTDFADFYNEYYSSDMWPNSIGDYYRIRPEIPTNRATFQLLTLNGLTFRQGEFDSMGVGLRRHKMKGWKKPHLSLAHQIALLCYGGSVNNQSFPYKQRMSDAMQNCNPELAYAAWGIKFIPHKGRINRVDLDETKLNEITLSRASSGVAVFMPLSDINKALAELDFTGDDAETMPAEYVDQQIRPKLKEILEGIIDTDALFIPGIY